MKRRIKFLKVFLCCLFHVKGYSWFAPWIREELRKDGDDE